MIKYIVLGQWSDDYMAGLIHNPQDRKEANVSLMKKTGAKWADGESFLHIDHPEYDFVLIMLNQDTEMAKAATDMLRATGNFKKINFFRAWSSSEYTKISKKASSLVGEYTAPSDQT